MHKKKSKNQIKKSLSICLLFLLILSYFVPVTLAYDQENFGFTSRTLIEHSEYDLSGTSYANFPQSVYFKDISYYQNDVTYMTFYVPDSMIDTFPSKQSGYQEHVEILESWSSDIICNASISYSVALQGVYIHVYNIEDWDVGAHTGETKITWVLDFNTANWNGLKIKSYTTIDTGFENETDIYIISDSTLPACEWADIHASATWLNWYQQQEPAYYPYQKLNVIRTDGAIPYTSTWNISDGDTNIYSESTLSSQNFSVILFEDTTTISCVDKYNNVYSDTLSWVPEPPSDDGVLNTISGTIKDAKTNAIIPSNPINLSTATGYGGSYSTTSTGAGAYSITNIIDDIYYIQANRSGYENYTFQKNITSNTEHIIYMVENITLDANKSGVYGIVTNYYNATGVPTTWMKISNDTWYQITYTNQNGYYEFLNFAPGNYTIQAQKTGYFPYEAALTFTQNELKYVPIELVSEEIPPDPTPTPTPPTTNILSPFIAIINSFGISESLGGAFIGIFIIVFMGALFSRAGTLAAIAGMFFGFISSIFMGLLPSYLLSITIIVVILLILRLRGDL